MMEYVFVGVLFIVVGGGIILAISQGLKQGAGSMTSTVLGANDFLLTKEQKRAAEVIVEQNAGKKLEEQSSKGLLDPSSKSPE